MEKFYDENGKEHARPKNVKAIWRISGYALIEKDGKILMVKPTKRNQWELPGGGIELTESINEGIVRECWEETGYKVGVGEQPIYLGERHFYSSLLKKFFRAVIMVYKGKILDKQQHKEVINTVEPDEIAETGWVDAKKLTENDVHYVFWPVVKAQQNP